MLREAYGFKSPQLICMYAVEKPLVLLEEPFRVMGMYINKLKV